MDESGASRWSLREALARLMDVHPWQLSLAIDTERWNKMFMIYDSPEIEHSKPLIRVWVRVVYRGATSSAEVRLAAVRHGITSKNLAPSGDGKVLFLYYNV